MGRVGPARVVDPRQAREHGAAATREHVRVAAEDEEVPLLGVVARLVRFPVFVAGVELGLLFLGQAGHRLVHGRDHLVYAESAPRLELRRLDREERVFGVDLRPRGDAPRGEDAPPLSRGESDFPE